MSDKKYMLFFEKNVKVIEEKFLGEVIVKRVLSCYYGANTLEEIYEFMDNFSDYILTDENSYVMDNTYLDKSDKSDESDNTNE